MESLFFDSGAMLAALVVIVAGSELFTNAVEHLGESFGLSEGLTGSVFAAVATALPETIVPVVAVASGGRANVGQHVGVGAILGSSFMLATLALTLVALFALPQRGLSKPFEPEPTGIRRDLSYFIVAFVIATASLFIPSGMLWPRIVVCVVLVAVYVYYVVETVRGSGQLVEAGHGTSADGPLWLCRIGLPSRNVIAVLQAAIALALIIGGARGFVWGIEHFADLVGFPVLVMSLILIPVATEMPEKINSILWIRRGRDTLAFGNITGAMVFQGTLLPAFGVFLDSWQPRADILTAVGLTIACSLWMWWRVRNRQLSPMHMGVNGAAYLVFLILVFAISI